MKVLLVGDFPPPHGGVAVHVELLQRAVRARGWECKVLDIGKGQLPGDGVVAGGGPLRFAAQLGWHARQGYRIHLHTSGANQKSWLLAGLCAAAGQLARQPAVVTFHSGLGPGWFAAAPVRRAAARAVTAGFGAVIAVSEEIRAALLSCGVAASKLSVVPAFSSSFLELGAPPQGLSQLRAEAAPLVCAMLAPGKVYGQEILLESFALLRKRVPRARLAVYGCGTSGLRAEGVTGFGELHRPSALALLSSCDVFVRPTLADGDSVSVREALALGKTVVATAVGNRPAEVKLCPPGDSHALALALTEAAAELISRAQPREQAPQGDGFSSILALYGSHTGAMNAGSAAKEVA